MSEVMVETSARHVHLSKEHIEVLFGKGAELTKKRELSQPGQFACEERVTVVGTKKSIPNVIVLGPARAQTQVEISLTDARSLGVAAPIRESGDLADSGACRLVGPCGEVEISEGVIAAKRHIHLDPATAEKFGVADKQNVFVKIETAERTVIFGDVVIRVSPKFAPAMHIDTDEANAAGISGAVTGEIIAKL